MKNFWNKIVVWVRNFLNTAPLKIQYFEGAKILLILPGASNYVSEQNIRESTAVPLETLAENVSLVVIGDGITGITGSAFYEYCGLDRVVLPSTLEKIGHYAFASCPKLTELDLRYQEDLRSIDERAFEDSGLTKVILNEGLEVVGYGVFSGTDIKEITLPESVISLDAGAFLSCENLKTVHILGEIKSIPNSCFQDCFALEEVDCKSQSVASIGISAFEGCVCLKSFDFQKSLVEINEGAFLNSGLKYLAFPTEQTLTVKKNAFKGCANLTLVNVPKNVILDGEGIFEDCTKIDSASITYVLSIPERTFAGCLALERVDFSKKLIGIRSGAFENCTNLCEIWIYDERSNTSTGSYCGAELPDKLIHIYDYAFAGCQNLAITRLPRQIVEIGEYAFSGCVLMKFTRAPKTLMFLGDHAFENCSSITSVCLPRAIALGENVFFACENLNTISFYPHVKNPNID